MKAPSPLSCLAFLVSLVPLAPSAAIAQSGGAVSIDVEARPADSRDVARSLDGARPAIVACVADAHTRVPELRGDADFVVHRMRASRRPLARPAIILQHSDLGDHVTEACLRRALRASVDRELASRASVDVRIHVSSPVALPTCDLESSDAAGCREVRPILAALGRSLERAPVRESETLGQSCGFTDVRAWLDRSGKVLAFGASSSNTDGESPFLHEYRRERTVALRVLSRADRAPAGARAALEARFSMGGCD